MGKFTRINVDVDKELWKRVKTDALKNDVSAKYVLERALELWIDVQEGRQTLGKYISDE